MSLWRIIMALIFPPFAVIDKGCGAIVLVFLLTMAGWLPGVAAALFFAYLDSQNGGRRPDRNLRYVQVPAGEADLYEKPKRKGAYVRLSDGDVLEVVEDDGRPLIAPEDKAKRDDLIES
ncbi:MAG: hypothetical protein BroJett038_04610 [Chloroflexota bacterium]|nr:MAG: hypothetical protein BroJett038_04610 [Chloroflexota bacterium]